MQDTTPPDQASPLLAGDDLPDRNSWRSQLNFISLDLK
jgi:hypothetical protein